MSKKDKARDAAPAVPEPVGPLGPFKLSIAVAVAMLFTGMPLWNAATSGVGVDMALLRSFGAAFLTWIIIGRLNRMLASIEADEVDEPSDDAASGGDLQSQPSA